MLPRPYSNFKILFYIAICSLTFASSAQATNALEAISRFTEIDLAGLGKIRRSCIHLVAERSDGRDGYNVRNFVNRGNTPREYMGRNVIDSKTGRPVDAHYGYSFGGTPHGRRGCIDVRSVSLAEARKALAAQGLTTKYATELEERTAGAAMIRIQQLNGGVLTRLTPGVRPYPFVYLSEHGSLRQFNKFIRMRRNGIYRTGESVGYHLHEFGHLVGNSSGGRAYSSYQKHMQETGPCKISKRSGDASGEQFAEVFAVFVAEPAALWDTTYTPDACKHAFNFFKRWFKKGDRVYDCM